MLPQSVCPSRIWATTIFAGVQLLPSLIATRSCRKSAPGHCCVLWRRWRTKKPKPVCKQRYPFQISDTYRMYSVRERTPLCYLGSVLVRRIVVGEDLTAQDQLRTTISEGISDICTIQKKSGPCKMGGNGRRLLCVEDRCSAPDRGLVHSVADNSDPV